MRGAVEKVLADAKCRVRTRELQKVIQENDPFATVIENIEDLVAKTG